jgi:hypothetical protein
MLTKDESAGLEAKMKFAYRHFGKPPPEEESLESYDPNWQNESATIDKEYRLTQLAEPWHFIVPPMTGGKLDLKANDSQWTVLRGFDSEEQCVIGIELVQQDYSAGGGLDYQATLHGKCVPAPDSQNIVRPCRPTAGCGCDLCLAC